ncbi:MAG: hypothetical protein ISS01_02705 [Nanoarchaeota archaeon]|nr:hypothetical protein [Nanoarchaeota archaeon]
MGFISELFFKTQLSLNRDNNAWKSKQINKIQKDIESTKSEIKKLKTNILRKEGQFEKLENNLKSWVVKDRPDLTREFEKYIKQINDYLSLFNKIIDLELKATLKNNPSKELKNSYGLVKAKKTLLVKGWKRLDQLGTLPPKGTKGIEAKITKSMRTLPPVIRKSVIDILKEFENIEILLSTIKANAKNIQKLKIKINSIQSSNRLKPAYSH